MHFANQPLIGSETGTLIILKHPYPRKVEEPSIYESVRVHTAMQTGKTETDLVPNAPSLGTKEGYLTKQGRIVKNWKTRWFTLHRNELKYYKDQTSTEPIRALDLTECSAVQFDYSQDKVNCFCLVFPLRTYYLYAKTGVEADEWIKILQWKLVRKCLSHWFRLIFLNPLGLPFGVFMIVGNISCCSSKAEFHQFGLTSC
uniref:Dual adaptor of phosphotyrosine and 3-phosphoinositides 1 n=1 Tax=Varanus komodoensis TaxID=61221 RepID=A0A8D2KYQ3_VARKO